MFQDGHYVVKTDWESGKGGDIEKIWPSTFYGLYDNELVVKLPNSNYTISDHGKEQIRC